jgi:hypothetical protein
MGHQQFWQRFLFRKALLEDEEARLQAKQKRLEEEKIRAEEEVQKCESTYKFIVFKFHFGVTC